MKLTVERKALADMLPRALAVVDRKGTIPILEQFLLTAETPGALHVAATDMDRRIELKVAARVEASGTACVPARLLNDAVKSLPEGSEIRIGLDGDRVTVTAGRSRFRLPVLPAGEFPAFEQPEASPFTLAARDLIHLIERTGHAISTEETRYYLRGIYLHPAESGDWQLRAVATNGHMLARADVPLPSDAADGGFPEGGVIVPRQMVEILRDWTKAAPRDAEADLAVTDRLIRVEAPWLGATVTSKLIDGTFPDYQRVIPKPGTTRVTVSAGDLTAAARRALVAATAKKDGRAVKLSIGSGQGREGSNRAAIRVSAGNDIGAEAESTVDADLVGEPLEIGFNAVYLAATVAALGTDTVTIDVDGPAAPARFENPADDSVIAVVMPYRV